MKKAFLITIILSCLFVKAQEKAKDTLFFKYNKKYIKEGVIETNTYYVLKDSNSDGTFYFEKEAEYRDLNPKKIQSLKKFVRSSKYYDQKTSRKLNDYRLYEFFRDYTIFLVRKNKFIKVDSGFEIE